LDKLAVLGFLRGVGVPRGTLGNMEIAKTPLRREGFLLVLETPIEHYRTDPETLTVYPP